MTYEDTLEYLYNSTPAFHQIGAAAYKPGLENTHLLMSHLNNPHQNFKSIHIAGTNGKGSCAHLIAAVLQQAGYKTGLYTSPHLVDYRERIRINGQMIPKEEVVCFVEDNKSFLEQVRPSFFETTMAMAFWYFAKQKVDIAVVEVGLGGRLDSTNIISPILSVITNIGYDHTEFLGSTLQEIAKEKAGIIKPYVPAVIGETTTETRTVFEQVAAANHSPLIFADQSDYADSDFYKEMVDNCQLKGTYQQKNILTVICALSVLCECQVNISDDDIRTGFKNVCNLTGLHGRWEEYNINDCKYIFDTGHNSHGIQYVAEQLKTIGEEHNLYIVFGMSADKDIEQTVALLPKNAHYYFTQAQTKRAIKAVDLCAIAQKHGLGGIALPTVQNALQEAKLNSRTGDIIFIGGSNYVVGEAMEKLNLCS